MENDRDMTLIMSRLLMQKCNLEHPEVQTNIQGLLDNSKTSPESIKKL